MGRRQLGDRRAPHGGHGVTLWEIAWEQSEALGGEPVRLYLTSEHYQKAHRWLIDKCVGHCVCDGFHEFVQDDADEGLFACVHLYLRT